ncbi:serine hydrolase [Erythrobacter sp. HKB08]|uniref:serine hydrolase domain-containing protein n=1 Tax=Erythrobacter sp. HKB08 TaxID=2502843 RepID=UPI0013E89E5F|nr:serine hydrolase domain-containing protein [Erythrobacter sp. HKB08]
MILIAPGLSASTDSARVDSFIEAELPASAAPGLAYARVRGSEVIARGFGERLEASGDPVTADTLFPIGSVTKSFTALAIMQLVEADQIGLDDPVSKYLPAFDSGAGSKVTLRQLLNHTSGYSTVQGNSLHGNAEVSQLGLADYAEQLALAGPAGAPGAHWEYSNANYQILGAVIERASGQEYADYIDAHIFTPLGMTDSTVALGASPARAATGHRPWFGGVRPFDGGENYRIHAPAGGIVSSARDMGRYLSMWLSGEDDILSAATKDLMLAPSSPSSPFYGLGWSIDPARGTTYHTGLVPGFETLAAFDPAEGTGVVIMVNANAGLGFADNWYLIGGAAARAMGQPHDDAGSRLGPQTAYLSIALLPPLFVLLALISWKGRASLRKKRESLAGKLGIWLPLPAMTALAVFLLEYLPRLFGGSIATLQLYQPDFAMCLIAAAILAPAWALLRVILAHSPARAPAETA